MMQQLRQYPGSEPSSSREPRVPRIPDRRLRQGEVENSEFSEISETSENIFPRFPAPSFPFCTSLYPKRKTRSLIKMRQGRFILMKTTTINVSNYLEHVPVIQFNQPKGGTP